jgi:hypothetical protein
MISIDDTHHQENASHLTTHLGSQTILLLMHELTDLKGDNIVYITLSDDNRSVDPEIM